MICKNCGKQLSDEARFCGGCGSKVVASEQMHSQTTIPAPMEPDTNCFTAQGNNTEFATGAVLLNGDTDDVSPNRKEFGGAAALIKRIKEKFESLPLKGQIFVIVAIALLAILFMLGIRQLVENVQKFDRDHSQNGAYTSTSTFTYSPPSTPSVTNSDIMPAEEMPPSETIVYPNFGVDFSIDELNQIITSYTAASNVSVSVLDLISGETFASSNADTQFVASGFYIPLSYVVYHCEDTDLQSSLYESMDTMMRTMSNGAANDIMELINTYSSVDVNSILKNGGFLQTSFNRNFGDVAASQNGYENYTSANDASRLIGAVYYNDLYKKMNINLQNDGIEVPANVSMYAHSGQGIGTSYNIFAVIESGTGVYAIAILTTDTGSSAATAKIAAAPIISAILKNVQAQMDYIYG